MWTVAGLGALTAGASWVVGRTMEEPEAAEELIDTVVLVGSIISVVVPAKLALAELGVSGLALAGSLAGIGVVAGYPLSLFLSIRKKSHERPSNRSSEE